jgi:hypothetical protein
MTIEPFVVKHYSSEERPSIKGNGFDGLEIGEDRAEAEEFVSWLNTRLVTPTPLPALGPEWQPCVKLPITVHVREQRPGESHVSTREGITPVREDDLIMRGVQGEEYPIGREVFSSTYRMGEATQPAATREAEISDEEWESLRDRLWSENHKVDAAGDQYMTYLGYEEVLYELSEVFNPVPAIRRDSKLWVPESCAVLPVPVSKRLPGAKDLDAANRCWWFAESHEGRDTAPTWAYTWHGDDDTHWLPHWALPVPAADKGEGQP